MSSLFKLKGFWYLQWRDGGRLIRRSLGIRVELDPRGKLAKQAQRDHDTAQARQIAGVEDERVTIQEGLDRYLATIRRTSEGWQSDSRSRADRIAQWMDEHGVRYWEEIRPAILDDYLEERGLSVSAKTARTEIDLLRSAARLLNKSRRVSPIPVDVWPTIARVTASRPERIGAYSADEIEAILEDLGKWNRRKQWVFPVLCLAYLGLRWSELERLSIRDIRLSPAPPSIRVESRKTAQTVISQHRWIEIHPRLLPEIQARMRGRRPGDRLIEDLPSKRDATNVLSRCCDRLGIQYRRLHGLRHFWISTLLSAGVPLAVVMKMAGHRNLSTTQGYLHLADEHAGWIGQALPSGHSKGHSF